VGLEKQGLGGEKGFQFNFLPQRFLFPKAKGTLLESGLNLLPKKGFIPPPFWGVKFLFFLKNFPFGPIFLGKFSYPNGN